MSEPQEAPGPPVRASGGRARDASIVFAAQIGAMLLTFAVSIVTARMLGPKLRGEYGMLITVANFSAVFANLGLAEAIVYFFTRGDADHRRTTSTVALGFLVSLGLACLAGLSLSPWMTRSYFPVGGATVAWIAVVSGAFMVLQRNSIAYLQAQRRFTAASFHGVARPALLLAALVVLWAAGAGLREATAAYGAAALVSGLVAFAPFAQAVRPASLDPQYLRRVAAFSAKSYSQVAINQMNYRLDIFIVAYLVDDLAAVAYYHIASGISAFLWVVPDAYGQILYPRLAAHRSERERTRETVEGVRVVLFLSVMAAAATGVVAQWLVPLAFGRQYQTASILLLLQLPGVVAMSVNKILTRYFVSRNRHQLNSYIITIAVCVGVAANFALVPRIGIAGAAIAASLAWTAMLVGLAFAFARTADMAKGDWGAFPRRELELADRTLRELRARFGRGADRGGSEG